MEFKTDALVIKATDYKENDKLLNLFTPSRGKLTAGIRGVRKPKAKLAFAAQPFCFAEYVLAEKGGRYTVTAAYLYDGFFALRTDIVRYYAACAVLEICDALLVEEGESRALFIAAAEALKGLSLTDGDACGVLRGGSSRSGLHAGSGRLRRLRRRSEGKRVFRFRRGILHLYRVRFGRTRERRYL